VGVSPAKILPYLGEFVTKLEQCQEGVFQGSSGEEGGWDVHMQAFLTWGVLDEAPPVDVTDAGLPLRPQQVKAAHLHTQPPRHSLMHAWGKVIHDRQLFRLGAHLKSPSKK